MGLFSTHEILIKQSWCSMSNPFTVQDFRMSKGSIAALLFDFRASSVKYPSVSGTTVGEQKSPNPELSQIYFSQELSYITQKNATSRNSTNQTSECRCGDNSVIMESSALQRVDELRECDMIAPAKLVLLFIHGGDYRLATFLDFICVDDDRLKFRQEDFLHANDELRAVCYMPVGYTL